MSKCVTMYEENKPSTLINDDQERTNFFRAIPVRSAMPKIKGVEYIYYQGAIFNNLTPFRPSLGANIQVHACDQDGHA